MFQYTSETIINSNNGALAVMNAADEPARFAALDKKGEKATSDADSILIDGVVALKAADIKCAYHTAYADPEKAQVTVEVPATVKEGDIVTLRVYLSEQGRSSSILQNAMLHKNRPFTYSVKAKEDGDAAGVAADLAKLIKKEMAQTDFKFFKATVEEESAVITLDALDCYVRFVDKYGVIAPAGEQIAEMLTIETEGICGCDTKVIATAYVAGDVVKLGSEGAGTVAHLIKDLRIPTSASTDPFHGDHGGMPIPGGKYDQYLLEVITERRHVGHNVMGALGASLTSFVFFVEAGAKTEFDAMLTAAGVTPKETADDFAKSTDDAQAISDGDMAEGDLKVKVPAGVGSIG